MKKFILNIFLLWPLYHTAAAGPVYERVYVQTDKEMYLAGELVWLKMITTDQAGIPLNFSKVGYVELLDGSTSRAGVSFEISSGWGSATLLLPPELETGCYRLLGYTRYQRNESEEVFFEKVIVVVNSLKPEILVDDIADGDKYPSADELSRDTGSSNGISLSVGRTVFEPRERVEVKIDNIPEDIHTLSFAVSGKDLVNSFTKPAIGQWRAAIPAPMELKDKYMVEYEGHIVTGKLSGTASGEYDPADGVIPAIAFQGDEVNLFTGQTDYQGNTAFYARRASGFTEMVTTFHGMNRERYRINLLSPFISSHNTKALPVIDIEKIDRERLLERSLGLQVQYAYVSDSIGVFDYPPSNFHYEPDYRYVIDEYRKFGTMGEVITEYVIMTQFRNIDGKWRLRLWQDQLMNWSYPLILMDGIPVFDHEIIYNYNPLLLERIDVYLDHFLFGGLKYDGLVAMYTEGNRAMDLKPDPYTHIVAYEMPQARRLFYAPNHLQELSADNRLPDFRHTLYWDPDVKTVGRQSVTVSFYTADLTGDYGIVVEGLTRGGETVWATGDLYVR